MKSLRSTPGIEFELVVMSTDIHYKEVLEWNIKIHYLVRATKKDVSVFKKFYQICKTFKPDIVHCWDSMTIVYAVPACKLRGIKLANGMVVDTPVKQDISNKHWLRGKLTFPFSNIVIGNSKAGLIAYGAPEKKSVCIYNGMDLARFDHLKDAATVRKEILGDTTEDIFVAGMVAAFEERKDYYTLIKAAKELVSRNGSIRFILIGGGDNFEEIKNSVPASLSEKIIFLGKRTDVESIVNIFDVGILLTNTKVHGEGISNSIIEYMALGKPVIATRGGGTNEVVIDDENGFLIDAESDGQLVERVEELFKNRELKDRLGKIGRQMAHEKFDLKIMMARYISTYRSLLKENNN